MEGVMMRGPQKIAMAVRQPDGEIYIEVDEAKTYAWQKWPLVRGVISFITSLITGYKCLMKSAEIALGDEMEAEEPGKFEQWIAKTFGDKGTNLLMAFAAVLGGCMALVLFMVVPTALAGLVGNFVALGNWRAALEGVLKLVMLVGYMVLISKMSEIKRLFGYHGAEHKTIACYESGKELTVENVRPCTRFHPRCGTSFLLIVILISIFVGVLISTDSVLLRILYKLLTLPLVMAFSYEIIKFCGRHDNVLTRAISAPGLWLQHITTNEPDDSMIECAIAAVLPVLPENKEEGKW